MRRWLSVCAGLLLTACSHVGQTLPTETDFGSRTDAELAKFLPMLADYPGLSWNVTSTVGAPKHPFGPYIDPAASVIPDGCADIPFQRPSQIAANTEGFVPNGVAGNSGVASVRIMREHHGADLIDESVQWAKRCHEYRINYPNTGAGDADSADPTAVSVLPPANIEGTQITRIHLTDNREHRFQPEGSRESLVSLAKVGDLVVVGYRHDNYTDADTILALTISRLRSGQPEGKPLSDKANDSLLGGRTDKEIQRLLPSALDLPPEWTVSQSTPILGERQGEYRLPTTSPASCERTPFENDGWSPDTDRDFRTIGTVTMDQNRNQHVVGEMARLGIEKPDTSVEVETTNWARDCRTFSTGIGSSRPSGVTIDLLPATQVDGIDITSVHVKGDTANRIDYTASLFRVRGVLVTTKPAVKLQNTNLARQIINNLQHAQYDTPSSSAYRGPYDSWPGQIMPPNPTTETTEKLARVERGALVDPEQYRPGGYMPGDAKTANPDYLHFRSPTGSIACTFRKYTLFCDVPRGTYPRTPKPTDLQGNWSGTTVAFGSDGIHNGVAIADPIVYAESNTLEYGHTIRLRDDLECLMERDGLTCIDYSARNGMHLSRDDLTPLAADETLITDKRSLPGR